MARFTVVGYYDSEDRKHVIGVLDGEHAIRGGYDPYEGGLFADLVEAGSWEEAEAMTHGRLDESLRDLHEEDGETPEVPC